MSGPPLVEPGDRATLWVDRADGECGGRVTVSSPVLDTTTVPGERSRATTTAYRDARPGAVHQVAFTRGGCHRHHETGRRRWRPRTAPLAASGIRGSSGHPRGAHAGEGGSPAGLDVGETGLGAALVTGSAGAAYRFTRRDGARDGT
ncbi:hypothetical protein ACWZEH_32295 [Streptomyces sp. QTS137]